MGSFFLIFILDFICPFLEELRNQLLVALTVWIKEREQTWVLQNNRETIKNPPGVHSDWPLGLLWRQPQDSCHVGCPHVQATRGQPVAHSHHKRLLEWTPCDHSPGRSMPLLLCLHALGCRLGPPAVIYRGTRTLPIYIDYHKPSGPHTLFDFWNEDYRWSDNCRCSSMVRSLHLESPVRHAPSSLSRRQVGFCFLQSQMDPSGFRMLWWIQCFPVVL